VKKKQQKQQQQTVIKDIAALATGMKTTLTEAFKPLVTTMHADRGVQASRHDHVSRAEDSALGALPGPPLPAPVRQRPGEVYRL